LPKSTIFTCNRKHGENCGFLQGFLDHIVLISVGFSGTRNPYKNISVCTIVEHEKLSRKLRFCSNLPIQFPCHIVGVVAEFPRPGKSSKYNKFCNNFLA
jgi:hypothetical protein